MSWLSDRWGQGGPFGTLLGAVEGKQSSINALKGDLANSIKTSADIISPFTGPWAPLVAGVGNAAGSLIAPGGNIGQAAKSGALGAAAGEAGSLLGSALGAGSAATSNGAVGLGASASPTDLGLGASDLPTIGDASTLPAMSSTGMMPGLNDVSTALSGNAPSTLADNGDSGWTPDDGPGSTVPLAQTGMGGGPGASTLTPPNATDPLGSVSTPTPSPLGTTPVNTASGGGDKSLFSKVTSALGKVPANLAGNVLSTIGNAPVNEAKAKQLALENQLYQQQINRQNSLDPLRQALAAAFQKNLSNPVPVAGNPYTKTGAPAPNPYASVGG